MAVTRNTKNVPYYILGAGAFSRLGELVDARRIDGSPALFYVDHFFRDTSQASDLPLHDGDRLFFVDTSSEPTVEYVDRLTAEARTWLDGRMPCCVVGMGGGAGLDTAKAVANLLANPGKAEDYQGWDLVQNAPPYKIGVPTLSGTGAECSRTCVLTNARRKLKLGMNSDHTVYDQLVLDPALTRSVPRVQFFYTGMDTYMHCFESVNGAYRNVIVDRLSQTAMRMCEDVFLGQADMMAEENLEAMMVASYIGGMAAGNTGLVHPLSAGLSIVLHLPHGRANCHALSVLEEFYPEEHRVFSQMLEANNISLPRGICKQLTDEQYDALVQGTLVHEKPLANALGPDFKAVLTRDKLVSLFKAM